MVKSEITFSDIRNGQSINVSTNHLSREKFLENLPNLLIENNWSPTPSATLCVNGKIEKLT